MRCRVHQAAAQRRCAEPRSKSRVGWLPRAAFSAGRVEVRVRCVLCRIYYKCRETPWESLVARERRGRAACGHVLNNNGKRNWETENGQRACAGGCAERHAKAPGMVWRAAPSGPVEVVERGGHLLDAERQRALERRAARAVDEHADAKGEARELRLAAEAVWASHLDAGEVQQQRADLEE